MTKQHTPAPAYEGQPGTYPNLASRTLPCRLITKAGKTFTVISENSGFQLTHEFIPSTDPLDGGWFINEGKPDIELPRDSYIQVLYKHEIYAIPFFLSKGVWDYVEYWRIEQPIKWL